MKKAMLILVAKDFMRFSLLRIVFIGLFLAIITQLSIIATKNYLAKLDVPPSYRHMDTLYHHKIIADVLDARKANDQTLLVMGDCVAFGHGVKKPFTSYMDIPDREIVNISMQSFKFEQMTRTLGEAKARGVTDVLIQLHPFTDYWYDEKNWKNLTSSHPIKPDIAFDSDEFDIVAQARANSKWQSTAQEISGKLGLLFTWRDWFEFSSKIRYDTLQNFPLFRNRHILDDILLKQSYYSERATRIDSFRVPLPEERQIDILKKQANLWKSFHIEDKQAYMDKLVPNSAAARLARAAEDMDMNATFVLVPTFVDKLLANTILERDDIDIMVEMVEKSVTQHGARFINLLEDPVLENHMRHYDNLTIEGHKILGEKLSKLMVSTPENYTPLEEPTE